MNKTTLKFLIVSVIFTIGCKSYDSNLVLNDNDDKLTTNVVLPEVQPSLESLESDLAGRFAAEDVEVGIAELSSRRNNTNYANWLTILVTNTERIDNLYAVGYAETFALPIAEYAKKKIKNWDQYPIVEIRIEMNMKKRQKGKRSYFFDFKTLREIR